MAGWAIETKTPAFVGDVRADPRAAVSFYGESSIKSMLVVPVRKSGPVGALAAYWLREYAPRGSHVIPLELLAEALNVTFANALAPGFDQKLRALRRHVDAHDWRRDWKTA